MEPPHATYRLQFHRGFTFRDALALVPYLASLGVSHVYASPLTEARPASTHGYDIVNHRRLNPEIGTEDEFQALVAALRHHGMGLILDIVPNHMGIGADNHWWMDVLEWGEASPFAHYFDINWQDGRPDLQGRVLLPVLGDQYGAVLEEGQIELRFDPKGGTFSFWYYEHRFPVSPLTYGRILAAGGPVLTTFTAEFHAVKDARDDARPMAEAAKQRLADAAHYPEIATAIEAARRSWIGVPGRRMTFRPLHRLLEAQAYRLAYWRVAADEINYRRFFNINDLAGIRVEMPGLFAETHKMIFAMVERGDIEGIRIDHIDGLFDPAAYLSALRRRCPEPRYIVVEKILARYEALPPWPIDGSTGYDFVNLVLEVFIDPNAEQAMTRLYQRLTGRTLDFDEVLQTAKRRIMGVNLASEMNVLARRFHRLSMSEWRTRDFTFHAMLDALRQVIGAFPVYRTYVSERSTGADDRRYIDWAVAQAKKQSRTADTSIFDFLHQVLCGEAPGNLRRSDVLRTAMQFQQVTGPVMAKAAEDTAFYRYFRLLALNEVGGDPRRFGLSLAGFHHLMRERARDWPRTMSGTATHDTKRGEDARVRLAMLSEMPRQWGQYVARWLRFNRSRRSEIDGDIVPDRNVEYLFYQTLVGAWSPSLRADNVPAVRALAERISAYMIKAVRGGKEESSWSNPNSAYEAALMRFVAMVLDASRPNAFLADFRNFIALIERPSSITSLAQLAIKLTAPGVPDIYQGCELWDFSMVDPDNRRPPDWEQRQNLLRALSNTSPIGLAAEWQDGREKLFLAARLLHLREQYRELFAEGEYLPLYGEGGRGDEHLCAFARRQGESWVVVAVPRLVYRLYRGGDVADWGATVLPLPQAGDWQDVLTKHIYEDRERIAAPELFSEFPITVLLNVRSDYSARGFAS
ncbi:MAG TPA: malto-oligosyltrehalose synthase [Stellaceae bacterium]|nr:malto-oligosyltrehalose synthase [Stellaceae bacterium]